MFAVDETRLLYLSGVTTESSNRKHCIRMSSSSRECLHALAAFWGSEVFKGEWVGSQRFFDRCARTHPFCYWALIPSSTRQVVLQRVRVTGRAKSSFPEEQKAGHHSHHSKSIRLYPVGVGMLTPFLSLPLCPAMQGMVALVQ